MDRFKKTVAKIIDHKALSNHLYNSMEKSNIFIDLGSGDCTLISLLTNLGVETIGIDIDDKKIKACQHNGFNVLWGDARHFSVPEILENKPLTLHAGFCLFNTFSTDEVVASVEKIFSHNNVLELFFEIQNKDYFQKRYAPGKKTANRFNEVTVVSWNEPFYSWKGSGVDVYMDYFSREEKLINSTRDRLFAHDINKLLYELSKIKSIKTFLTNWPIRFDVEEEHSHFYLCAKRKIDE